MIRTLEEVSRRAREMEPKKLAVLAPEDSEFMMAVKKSTEAGYIDPVLIGNQDKMNAVAGEVGFDITNVEKIFQEDRQTIADLGTAMLFSGEVDMSSKGQIPTSYIYRSIIREEAKLGTGRTVSVVTLWEIPELRRFTCFTDTGVNIHPDYKAKTAVIKNAVFLFHVLGYEKPRISVLSGHRDIGGDLASYTDGQRLKEAAAAGEFGACEIIDGTSFHDFTVGTGKRMGAYDEIDLSDIPEILLVPSLDTGNILCKLDFFLNVYRRSLVMTSRGPALIPSRSDFSDSIVGEIAMGVVVADRLQRGVRNDD
jgi:phosphate butyryltransferase